MTSTKRTMSASSSATSTVPVSVAPSLGYLHGHRGPRMISPRSRQVALAGRNGVLGAGGGSLLGFLTTPVLRRGRPPGPWPQPRRWLLTPAACAAARRGLLDHHPSPAPRPSPPPPPASPYERAGVIVPGVDPGLDRVFELGHRRWLPRQPLGGQLGEPALDQVQPGAVVGVKWSWKRGWATSQRPMAGVLWVEGYRRSRGRPARPGLGWRCRPGTA